jgi:hypothetical protein
MAWNESRLGLSPSFVERPEGHENLCWSELTFKLDIQGFDSFGLALNVRISKVKPSSLRARAAP